MIVFVVPLSGDMNNRGSNRKSKSEKVYVIVIPMI